MCMYKHIHDIITHCQCIARNPCAFPLKCVVIELPALGYLNY